MVVYSLLQFNRLWSCYPLLQFSRLYGRVTQCCRLIGYGLVTHCCSFLGYGRVTQCCSSIGYGRVTHCCSLIGYGCVTHCCSFLGYGRVTQSLLLCVSTGTHTKVPYLACLLSSPPVLQFSRLWPCYPEPPFMCVNRHTHKSAMPGLLAVKPTSAAVF